MDNNKPKKEVIGESKVMHVNKGFAIAVIIPFMTLLLIFSICWAGVLAADAVCDNIINPMMLEADPEAEPIDVMAVMNPPTSEQEAAKVYAKFPSLNISTIFNTMSNAFSKLPEGLGAIFSDVGDAAAYVANSFVDTLKNDPSELGAWFSDELGPTINSTAASIGNNFSAFCEEFPEWYDAQLTPAVEKSAEVASKTIETYPSDFEKWYDDHLPFRSIIFNTNQKMEGQIEKPYGEVQNKMAASMNLLQEALMIVLDMEPEKIPENDPQFPDIDLEIPDDPNEETDPPDIDDPPEYPTEELPPFDDTETEEGNGGSDPNGGSAVCEHEENKGEIETPATCTEYGVKKYSCTKCGKTMRREYIAKASHQYVEDDYTIPICGATYTIRSTCSVCSNEKVKNVVKKHVKGSEIKTVSPSYASYGYTLNRCKDCGGEYRTNLKNKLYDSSYFLPIYHNNTVMEGREKWLFYRGDSSEAYFQGTNLMTESELQEYVEVMNELNKICKEKGITLQICIWPNKEQVYPEYVGVTPVTQEKRIDLLVDYVRANSDVKIIYPIEELKKAKPYYDMYFKYDTHWNNAGGFVGHQAMLASLGLDTVSINNAPVYSFTGGAGSGPNTDPYLGPIADMISLGNLSPSNYTGNFNYYIKYLPDVKVDSFSGKNGAGDTRHTTAANAPNDYNFVMLADSYRVMQLSYLEKEFTDCFLTHRSHVKDEDVKEAIKNSDILVIAAVERLEKDILTTAKEIINILSE